MTKTKYKPRTKTAGNIIGKLHRLGFTNVSKVKDANEPIWVQVTKADSNAGRKKGSGFEEGNDYLLSAIPPASRLDKPARADTNKRGPHTTVKGSDFPPHPPLKSYSAWLYCP